MQINTWLNLLAGTTLPQSSGPAALLHRIIYLHRRCSQGTSNFVLPLQRYAQGNKESQFTDSYGSSCFDPLGYFPLAGTVLRCEIISIYIYAHTLLFFSHIAMTRMLHSHNHNIVTCQLPILTMQFKTSFPMCTQVSAASSTETTHFWAFCSTHMRDQHLPAITNCHWSKKTSKFHSPVLPV